MMNKKQSYLSGKPYDKNPNFALKNPEERLSEFGLSENQSKVYLYLNKNGTKPASHLSQILNIPRTEIYAILKTLQRKGCVEFNNEKPLKVDSIPFEEFLEKIISLKRNEIQKLENTLSSIKSINSTNSLEN